MTAGATPRRTVVVVSPYFPPSTLAGVHRARHLARHLPAAGWTPIVLAVDETYHEQSLDPALARLVPAATEIVKVAALPVAMTRPLGIGEISLRAWSGLRGALCRLLASRPVDAVLITGGPFYPMLLAPLVRRRFGTPVVLDFQDPWVSRWGGTQPLTSKAGLAHLLATRLEPRALGGAALVTSVSATQNAEMAARYPGLDAERMAAIPIGGDPDDFVHVRTRPAPAGTIAADRINLSFVGTFMPRSGSLVRTLFRAFRRLRSDTPQLAPRIRMNFIGTSNQPDARGVFAVRALAETEGIAEAVHEIPQRLPYLDALAVLAHSDGILLVGSDEPHYTASKIYPALMSGQPYLSLFHAASSAHEILSRAGGGLAHAFPEPTALVELEPALARSLATLAEHPETLGRAAPSAYAAYEARAVARQFADVLERSLQVVR